MALKLVTQSPVRIGIVGCGVVSDYGHIPAIDRLPEAEIVGFVDPAKDRREAQAKKYNKPGFASFEEMIAAVDLDAVSIPTHPKIKLSLIRIAAAHGLHAFCEKPLTDTVAEADELLRLMDDNGLFVGMSFVYRGKKSVQRMMELVREGAIGKLRAVHIENMWDYHGVRGETWGETYVGRRQRALQNMGTLDCGVHNLDLIRYMSGGDFSHIQAIGDSVEASNRYPDHIMLHARMTNGVMASLEESAVWGYTATDAPRYEQSYRMVGEKGVLCARVPFADNAGNLYVVSGEKQWTEDLSSEKAWDDTYRQFFQTILGEPISGRFIADGHDALANMQAAQAVIEQCQATRDHARA